MTRLFLSDIFPHGPPATPRPPEPEDLWMTLTARGLVREDLVKKTDTILILRATPARDEQGQPIKRHAR